MKEHNQESSDQGNIEGQRYDWPKIRHFFVWHEHFFGRQYFIAIDENGKVDRQRVKRSKYFSDFKKLW